MWCEKFSNVLIWCTGMVVIDSDWELTLNFLHPTDLCMFLESLAVVPLFQPLASRLRIVLFFFAFPIEYQVVLSYLQATMHWWWWKMCVLASKSMAWHLKGTAGKKGNHCWGQEPCPLTAMFLAFIIGLYFRIVVLEKHMHKIMQVVPSILPDNILSVNLWISIAWPNELYCCASYWYCAIILVQTDCAV